MLKGWLAPREREAFLASRSAGLPFATPAVRDELATLFDAATLLRVLGAEPAPDALIVRRSELLDRPPPRSEPALRALLEEGAGVVVRRAERHDLGLLRLATQLASELGGVAHVQLFVTPASTHGFGWHYDAEDVFILQTVGAKTYFFRANTQQPDLRVGAQPDFTKVRAETSPTQSCTLIAGGALYLPRGMWHAARAEADSFSISVGLW